MKQLAINYTDYKYKISFLRRKIIEVIAEAIKNKTGLIIDDHQFINSPDNLMKRYKNIFSTTYDNNIIQK